MTWPSTMRRARLLLGDVKKLCTRTAVGVASASAQVPTPLSRFVQRALKQQHTAPTERLAAVGRLLVGGGAGSARSSASHGSTEIELLEPLLVLELCRLMTPAGSGYECSEVNGFVEALAACSLSDAVGGTDSKIDAVVRQLVLSVRRCLAAEPCSAAAEKMKEQVLRIGCTLQRLLWKKKQRPVISLGHEDATEWLVMSTMLQLTRDRLPQQAIKFMPCEDDILRLSAMCIRCLQTAVLDGRTEMQLKEVRLLVLQLWRLAMLHGQPSGAVTAVSASTIFADDVCEDTQSPRWESFLSDRILFPDTTSRPVEDGGSERRLRLDFSPDAVVDLILFSASNTGCGSPASLTVQPASTDERFCQVLMQIAAVKAAVEWSTSFSQMRSQDHRLQVNISLNCASTAPVAHPEALLRCMLPLKAYLDSAVAAVQTRSVARREHPCVPVVYVSLQSFVALTVLFSDALKRYAHDEPLRLLDHKPRVHLLADLLSLLLRCVDSSALRDELFGVSHSNEAERRLRALMTTAKWLVRRVMSLKHDRVAACGAIGALLTGGASRESLANGDVWLRNAGHRVLEPSIREYYHAFKQLAPHRSKARDVAERLCNVVSQEVSDSEIFTLRHPLQCSPLTLLESWRCVAVKLILRLTHDIRGAAGESLAPLHPQQLLELLELMNSSFGVLQERLDDVALSAAGPEAVDDDGGSGASQDRMKCRLSDCLQRTLGLVAVASVQETWSWADVVACRQLFTAAAAAACTADSASSESFGVSNTLLTREVPSADEALWQMIEASASFGLQPSQLQHFVSIRQAREASILSEDVSTNGNTAWIGNRVMVLSSAGLLRRAFLYLEAADDSADHDGVHAEADRGSDATTRLPSIVIPWWFAAEAAEPLRFYDTDNTSEEAWKAHSADMALLDAAAQSKRVSLVWHSALDDVIVSCPLQLGGG